jgi:hypothetical protein
VANGVSVSWATDVAEAESYILYYGTTNDPINQGTPINNITQNNYEVTGLTPNTTYYFTVRAITTCSTTNAAPVVSTIPFDAIYAGGDGDGHNMVKSCQIKPSGTLNLRGPSTVNLTPFANAVTVSWATDVAEAESYILYYGTTNDPINQGTPINNITQNNYQVTGLTPNTTYYFTVRAITSCSTTNAAPVVSTVPFDAIYAGGDGDGHNMVKSCQIKPSGTLNLRGPSTVNLTPFANAVTVSWATDVAEAESYILYYGTTNDPINQGTPINNITQNNYQVTSLTPNTTYYFTVRAITSCSTTNAAPVVSTIPFDAIYAGGDGDGHSRLKTCQIKPDGTPNLKGPSAVNVTPFANSVTVSWATDVAEAESYILYYGTTNDPINQGTPINNITQNNYQVTSLTPNTTYYFTVRAVTSCSTTNAAPVVSTIPFDAIYAGGNGDGFTNIESCIIKPSGLLNINAPNSISATPGSSQITLTWGNNVVTATSYTVYYSTVPNAVANGQTITGVTSTSYVLTGLSGGTTYYIQVVAVTDCGNSPPTSEVSETPVLDIYQGGNGDGHNMIKTCQIKPNGTLNLKGPSAVNATPFANSVTVSWATDVAEAESYILYYGTTNDPVNQGTPINNITQNNYQVTGLTPNTTYYFGVRAITSCSTSNISPIASTIPFDAVYAGGNGDGHSLSKSCLIKPSGTINLRGPSAINATPNANGATVSWATDVTETENYILYFGTTNDPVNQGTPINNISQNSYDVTGLTPNTTYYFAVRAVTSCSTSNPSPIASTIPFDAIYAGGNGDGHSLTKSCLIKPDGTINLRGPSAINATPIANGAIVSWATDVTETETYTLYYGTTNDPVNQGTPINNITQNNYQVTGLTPNITYYFAVRAVTSCSTSNPSIVVETISFDAIYAGGDGDGYSLIKSCLVKPDGTLNLNGPNNIITIPEAEGVTLQWNSNVAEVESYTIYYSTTNNPVGNGTPIPNIKTTNYKVLGLSPNTRYYFAITATTSCTTTNASNIVNEVASGNFYVGGNGDGFALVQDSLTKLFQPPMFGIYTIKKFGSGLRNYNRIELFAKDLGDRGVSDSVLAVMMDTTYTDESFPVKFNYSTGVSETNYVKIKPDTNSYAKVIGNVNNAIIKIEGLKHFYISGNNQTNNHQLQIINNSNGSNAAGIWASESVDNNSLDSLRIQGIVVKGGGAGKGIVVGDIVNNNVQLSLATNKIDIINNQISNFDIAIKAGGYSHSDYIKNMVVRHNLITQTGSGIDIGNASSVIEFNTIRGRSYNSASAFGIHLNNNFRSKVIKNKIYGINAQNNSNLDTAIVGGIVLSGIDNNQQNTIMRNWISGLSTQNTNPGVRVAGIIVRNSNTARIYHNNIYLAGNTVPNNTPSISAGYASGLNIGSACISCSIRNNVFVVNDNNPYGFANFNKGITNNTSVFSRNALYSTGKIASFNNTDFTNLSTWRNSTNLDTNSIYVLPTFTSDSVLSLSGNYCDLKNKGAVLDTSVNDFQNQSVLNNRPDIGAEEIPNSLPGYWLGIDSNWANVNSWCDVALPTNLIDVNINSSAVIMPVLNNGNASVKNLIIDSGASLTVRSGRNLTIAENFVKNGNLIFEGNTSMTFAYNGNQNIPAGAYHDLIFTGSGNKTIDGNIEINNQLTTTNAMVITNQDTIVLLDTSATLSETSSGYVSGWVRSSIDMNDTTRNYQCNQLGINLHFKTNPGGLTRVIRKTDSTLYGNGNFSINRYFLIQPTNNSNLDCRLRMNYLDADLNGITETDLVFFSSNDNGQTFQGQGKSSQDVNNNWVAIDSIQHFTIYVLGDNLNPLPVELLEFAARKVSDHKVLLNWKTATEINNFGFDVQRSTNGFDFIDLGFVEGNGTTQEVSSYQFFDNNAPLQQNSLLYYRLKQKDFDGQYAYSPIETIRSNNTGSEEQPLVWFDMTTKQLHINADEPSMVEIIDNRGVVVANYNTTSQSIISLDGILASGLYHCKVRLGNKNLSQPIVVLK